MNQSHMQKQGAERKVQ